MKVIFHSINNQINNIVRGGNHALTDRKFRDFFAEVDCYTKGLVALVKRRKLFATILRSTQGDSHFP